MRKRIVGLAVALLLAAGAVGMAAPASAASQPSNCPSGATCTWGDRYYLTSHKSTARMYFYQFFENYAGRTYPGVTMPANDTATSIYNHGTKQASYLYSDAYHGGDLVLTLPVGKKYDQLNAQVPKANDIISSGYFDSFN